MCEMKVQSKWQKKKNAKNFFFVFFFLKKYNMGTPQIAYFGLRRGPPKKKSIYIFF